ncbi:hypothetical protein GIB67_012290 [Kingdonia uniflora]|uniref:Uncharacterized protein n=1 Tax=Kingdonia uniflora TaxID=39325 RepID=A0A7J7N4L9_9MAGN|nr:hypothetical protein GIB67_012290 [Kingdonia uniflora]
MAETLKAPIFIKQLASCNKTTRDRATRHFQSWLPSQTQLSDDLMKKIWKGLFYCVWHSDKQQVQMQLIDNLSSLLVTLDLPLSIQYFEVFLISIRREWGGIDFLRLDKFYLLIRKFLSKLFLVLKNNLWDLELVNRLMAGLEEKTLLSVDKCPAQGVNYHIAEVYLEELKPYLPIKLENFEVLLKPFFSVMGKSHDKVLLNKIKTYMFGRLIEHGNGYLETKKGGDSDAKGSVEVEVYGAAALKLGFLHDDFLKLEKGAANSGVEVVSPEVNEDANMDEVPELVAINGVETQVADGSADKTSKKKKKRKLEKGSANSGIEIVGPEVDEDGKMDEVPDLVPNNDMVSEVDTESSNGSADKGSKKTKKGKKASGETKSSKKKNETTDSDALEVKEEMIGNGVLANEESLSKDGEFVFNESVISNLQMQFEKVAAEVGMDVDGGSSFGSPLTPVNGTLLKKRKRAKSSNGKKKSRGEGVNENSDVGKSVGTSVKKVRFQMNSNLVWKPHSPLPPQSVRVPPSATPRGSALKKGVPAGPVREMPKKAKLRSGSAKKARKSPRLITPTIKRLRKLRPASA